MTETLTKPIETENRKSEWGVVQKLTVEADTKDALIAALTIALSYHSKVHYWECRKGKLALLWSNPEDTYPFLTPLDDPEQLAGMVLGWLLGAAYPEERPDTDGSVKKGFRVRGHEDGYGYTVATIEPVWIVYGK